ncbi:MAG: hypothetical protein U1G07_16665 [Verrucomicrobiota bacterium]
MNSTRVPRTVQERLAGSNLLQTLIERRSRRFGLGMKMPAGPLAYQSRHRPCPLTEDEEAAVAFSAAGITGYALADLCYAKGEGGNIMNGLVGRAVGSGDGIQAVALFVINDTGAWVIKRPRDFNAAELAELVRLGRAGQWTEFYRRSRVQVKTGRAAAPLDPVFNINCNRWSLYAPGTSYFLPVNDLTFLYINGLLEVFNETTGLFILDERARFCSAGVGRFARRRGGHLDDDPRAGKVATIELLERLVTEFVTVEQGMMHQNMALVSHALGLGGFPNFANHEFGWFQALGFTMGQMPASQYLGAGRAVSLLMGLLGRDQTVPFPLGLEAQGQVLLKAYCPPYFPSMREAVKAVVRAKTACFQKGAPATAWTRSLVCGEVPEVSPAAVEATVAYCEYVWKRYGRFPAYLAPFRTVVGFQACHLDAEFYDQFYQTDALSQPQREDYAAQIG